MEVLEQIRNKYSSYTNEKLVDVIVSQWMTINSLKDILFGKKSEKHADTSHMTGLFDEAESLAEKPLTNEILRHEFEDTINVKGHSKKRGKRAPLPAYLPRERVEHDLHDHEKVCPIHHLILEKIGEKTSEQLEIIPAQVKVIENVTFTYKCPSCTKEGERETIICSRMAPTPIPKSFASPSLLAYIATA